MTKHFPAKILLFGEYAVIRGSDALITPYREFSGHIESSGVTHPSIRDLHHFCVEQQFERLNMKQRKHDIDNNLLNYTSSIPMSYGIGSSGALVAAIYDRYRTDHTEDITSIHTHLSQMESWFHGHSSGMDPLTSFLQKPLHKTPNAVEKIEDFTLPNIKLIDTQQLGSTKENVERFKNKLSDTSFTSWFDTHFVTNTNQAIHALIHNDYEDFRSSLHDLSQWTLAHMTRLIPEEHRDHRQTGIDTGNYYCKLCGSGGGGFILQYNRHENI